MPWCNEVKLERRSQYLGFLDVIFAVEFLRVHFRDITEELLTTSEEPGIKEAASINESSARDLTTSAKGSSGMNPGPVLATIDTRPFSSIGDWLEGDRNKLARLGSRMLSTVQRRLFIERGLGGGGTELDWIRAREDSRGSMGCLDTIPPSSVYTR